MELTLIKLSMERILEKVEILEERNHTLESRIAVLEAEGECQNSVDSAPLQDELLDTKEVLRILGISYNTLQVIVRKGMIKPIRINQRRIRFASGDIQNYIAKCRD